MFASTRNFSRNLAGAAGTLLLAGLCIAGATAPAQARTNPVTYGVNAVGERTAMVSFADLNLSSPKGRAALENRIRNAARTVCSANGDDKILGIDASRCFHDTLTNTRRAVQVAIVQLKADKPAD